MEVEDIKQKVDSLAANQSKIEASQEQILCTQQAILSRLDALASNSSPYRSLQQYQVQTNRETPPSQVDMITIGSMMTMVWTGQITMDTKHSCLHRVSLSNHRMIRSPLRYHQHQLAMVRSSLPDMPPLILSLWSGVHSPTGPPSTHSL